MTATEEQMRRPGRPRSARAHQAIIQVTLALLAEVGFEALSLESVAARAGAGKTTIYRWWPSKEALVREALEGMRADVPVIDTGDLRTDLLTVLRGALGILDSPTGTLIARLIAEVGTNPPLFHALQSSLIEPRVRQFRDILARAQERGQLRPGLDLTVALDLIAGPYLYRLLIGRHMGPTPPDYAARMVEAIWRGIGAESSPPIPPRASRGGE